MTAAPVRIAAPRRTGREGLFRIEAQVDGFPVWFESRDAALMPAPEAWGSLFLLPALHHRRGLALDAAVDPVWAGHMERVRALICRAWRYPAQTLTTGGDAPAVADPGRARGLFFTAGVDSFHGLLCTDERPEVLVNVHGFDVALGDAPRQSAAEASIAEIARDTGTRALFLATNLREHPLVRGTPWDAAHGGALAAAGHVLGGALERVAIASSQPRWSANPWGSHWSTDPLWSSASVTFVHLDADLDRLAKIRHIAEHAVVQRHLRVCWTETGARANCSRCEKCMITMLGLLETGHLDACTLFDGRGLYDLVRSRRRSRWRLPMLRELSRSPRLPPDLRRAVRAMWLRSVLWKSPAGPLLRGLAHARRAAGLARRRGA
jgi:hypothetical protein